LIDATNIAAFARGEEYDEQLLWDTSTEIIRLVISRHFSSYRYLHDDMFSVGYEKIISLLRSGHVDPSRNLVNFLYTGIRNSVGNWLKQNDRQRRAEEEAKEENDRLRASSDVGIATENPDFVREVQILAKRFEHYVLSVPIELDRFLREGEWVRSPLAQLVIKVAAYRAAFRSSRYGYGGTHL